MTACRVALVGAGVVSPLGVGSDQVAQALAAGRTAAGELGRIAALGLPASRGAEVGAEALQPHLGRLPRKQQKLYSRATLFGVLAASLAMEDAGLAAGAGDPERFGVLLGVNVLAWDLAAMTQYLGASESPAEPGTLDLARANQVCMRQINPLDFSVKTLPNLAAGHLAIAHGAQGICRALTEGPLGGLHAIGQAWRLLAEGDLDVALAGGADAQAEELIFATCCGARLFGWNADGDEGPVAGEGAGLLVLEEAARAHARGARVRAEVLGFAATAGDGTVFPEDRAERLAPRIERTVRAVIEEAGVAPDLVSVHGDGAAVHEAAERMALDEALGVRAGSVTVLRMKAAQGDLGAASGPVEVAACAERLGQDARHALVLSLGFFGECAALMLGRP